MNEVPEKMEIDRRQWSFFEATKAGTKTLLYIFFAVDKCRFYYLYSSYWF